MFLQGELPPMNPMNYPSSKLRILLADDSMIHQVLTRGILSREGHDVTVAGNGREAVMKFQREVFDVVLMDVEMPEMDGITATRLIRDGEKQHGVHTPIVALTSYPHVAECLAAGMDEYLSKPCQAGALRDTLERVVGPQRLTA